MLTSGTGWALWSTPAPVRAYVLVIDLLALAAAATTTTLFPITGGDWATVRVNHQLRAGSY